VRDLFPDMAVLTQAGELIHQHNPDVTPQGWGALISGLSNNPDGHAPELIEGLRSLFGSEQYAAKLGMLSFNGTVNPEKILPSVLLMTVAQGMRGILVLALIAASMSTFDSTVNMATGLVVNDLYRKYFRPKAQTKELIRASWATVALLVVGGVLFAQNAESIEDIWGWLMMGLGGAFLVPNLLRLYWWRFNGMGTAVGSLVGMTAAIVQRIIWPEMNEFMQLGYSLVAGMVGGVIATFCDKPTDPEVLKEFYMKTRPFGIWGHLKRQLSEEDQKKVTKEHITDLAAIPFALTWQVTMFLAPMLFVVHNWKGFTGTMVLFLLSGGGLYWFWYRHQPETNFYE